MCNLTVSTQVYLVEVTGRCSGSIVRLCQCIGALTIIHDRHPSMMDEDNTLISSGIA